MNTYFPFRLICHTGHHFAYLLKCQCNGYRWYLIEEQNPRGDEIEFKNKKTELLAGWANMQLKSYFIHCCPHKELKHSESAEEIELLCYYHNATITFGKGTVSSVQTLGSHFKAHAYSIWLRGISLMLSDL